MRLIKVTLILKAFLLLVGLTVLTLAAHAEETIVVEPTITEANAEVTKQEASKSNEVAELKTQTRKEQRPSFRYSGKVLMGYAFDRVSNINRGLKEFELNSEYNRIWRLYLRAGNFHYVNEKEWPDELNKVRLSYKKDNLSLTLGDFSQVYGRGLALNMFEHRESEIDREVRGVNFNYSFGNGLDLNALYGIRQFEGDTEDTKVVGGQLSYTFPEGHKISLQRLLITSPEQINLLTGTNYIFNREYDITGASTTLYLPLEAVFNGDYVVINRNANKDSATFGFNDNHDGFAWYANLQVPIYDLNVNLEAYKYEYANTSLTSMPPGKRYEEKATANADDEYGFNVELIMPLGEGGFIAYNAARSSNKDASMPYNEKIVKVSFPHFGPFSLQSTAEWIYENEHSFIIKTDRFKNVLQYELNRDVTLGLTYDKRRISDGGFNYNRHMLAGDINLLHKYQITYSEDAQQVLFKGKKLWKLWEVKMKLDDFTDLNFTNGERRPGTVCTGGVCRIVPESEGWNLYISRRF